jgi:polysaccharide biosynthesis transport protein
MASELVHSRTLNPWPEAQQLIAGPTTSDFFREHWRILQKRKWVAGSTLIVVTALVAFASLRMTPMYEAVGRIAINRENQEFVDPKEGGDVDNAWDYTIELETQSKMLESDELALEVIKTVKLYDKDQRFHLNMNMDLRDPIGLSLSRLDSRERSRIVNTFHESLTVTVVPRTRVIEVRFLSPSPEVSAKVVNAVVDSYIQRNVRTKFDSTQKTSDVLARQLNDLRIKVESSQENLVRYQKQNGILGIDDKQNLVTSTLDQLNKELTAAQTGRIEKETNYRIASSTNSDTVENLQADELLAKLQAQRTELKAQYAKLRTDFGPNYPTVIEMQHELDEKESAIRDEIAKLSARVRDQYSVAAAREARLRSALNIQKTEANTLNERAIEYNILKHDVEASRQLYEHLLQKLKEAGIAAGLRSSNVSIIDLAQAPDRPSRPRTSRNLVLGLFMGLAAGLGLAFIVDAFDSTLRTPDDVRLVSALPSLGIIPKLNTGQEHGRKLLRKAAPVQTEMALVTYNRPKSDVAESFRTLRTSVLLSSSASPPKVILITSSLPEEGKTTTSINCAVVLAQKGARVLLVDADLRRPSIHEKLGLRNARGLSTVLSGCDPVERALIPSAQLTNLFVLTAGPVPPNPAELLGAPIMKSHLNNWRQQFDHIVVDSPPVLSVTDGVILAVEADSVLLVVRSGQTQKESLRHTRDLLTSVNARIMGVVVNAVDLEAPGTYYYGYGSKYGSKYFDADLSAVS